MRCPLALPVLFLLLISPASSFAGQTSNGCSYKVINGEYHYDCKNAPAPAAPAPAPATPIPSQRVTDTPITSYSAAPMAAPSERAVPSANIPTMNISIAPPVQNQTINTTESSSSSANTSQQNYRDEFLDATYVGVMVGGSTISGANAGSALGAGLTVGTNLDEYLGIEIAYAYTKQDLYLNLAARGAATTMSPYGSTFQTNDSAVNAHLLSAEIQFHLTDSFKRLRPYAGLGLGWKQSTLSEKNSAPSNNYNGYNYGMNSVTQESGTLSQSSIGALASLGTKFRFSKNLQGLIAMRYFLPVSSQAATRSGAVNHFNSGDSDITSSSLYQIVGGVQYAF